MKEGNLLICLNQTSPFTTTLCVFLQSVFRVSTVSQLINKQSKLRCLEGKNPYL